MSIDEPAGDLHDDAHLSGTCAHPGATLRQCGEQHRQRRDRAHASLLYGSGPDAGTGTDPSGVGTSKPFSITATEV